MEHSQKHKGGIEMKEDPVVLVYRPGAGFRVAEGLLQGASEAPVQGGWHWAGRDGAPVARL